MPRTPGPDDLDVTIRFGRGLHTRASEDEIDQREAADGINFDLDPGNGDLKNRKPFDLIGTVPNTSPILGGGSLLEADGTVSTIIQAGTDVYEWDGLTTFTPIGTVVAGTRLRGHWRSHNWELTNTLLLTDIALQDQIKEWDGTTFQTVAFTDEAAQPFGTFKAKYLDITDERAIFFNTEDVAAKPQLIVGTQRSDYTVITIANRPSSALNEGDPFFLVSPDLRAINGAVNAFGSTIISTQKGRTYNLSGTSAKDFAFADFYAGSSAAGDEALTYIGNDVIYGRNGRIESVTDTERFGDSEADDLTVPIANEVQNYNDWTAVYNSRLNRVYLFPGGQSELWSFETAMLRQQTSAWMRWTTQHPIAFQPTFVMSMLDPQTGLEFIGMGDSDGNFYRLEGTGASGDGGTSNVRMEWLTRLYSVPLDAEAFDVEGYIKYRRGEAATVSLQMEWSGRSVRDDIITVSLPAQEGEGWYNTGTTSLAGDVYYNSSATPAAGDGYYGVPFLGRLTRQRIEFPGQSEEFQVRVIAEGTTDVEINEIGLRFRAAG